MKRTMNAIRRFRHSVRDWARQWIQFASLVVIIPMVFLLDISGQFLRLLDTTKVQVSELDVEYRISLGIGNPALSVVLFITLLLYIRRCNKGYVLKQNTKIIAWHTLAGYWLCCRILNYRTILLTRVPIPVQIKVVFNNLFDEYRYMDGVTELQKADNVRVVPLQDYDNPKIVNVFLADTYQITDWEKKLPTSEKLHHTIIIDRSSEERGRYYSKEYVSKIRSAILSLPETVDTINIFATINAAHCFHITRDVFMTGGSDRFKILRIYEQNKQTWKFDGKYREIKLK